MGTALMAALLAGVPDAEAFSVTGAATVSAGATATLAPNGSNESLPDVTVTFSGNATTSVWSTGDSLTFTLWDATAGAALSNTVANSQQRAAFHFRPSIKSSVPGVSTTVSLTHSANSSVSDEFALTFGQDAAKNTATTTFTISGLAVDLGSKIPSGHNVQLRVSASNGTPFAGNVATSFAAVGWLPALSAAVASVANSTPGALGVTTGALSVTDLAGGTFQNGDTVSVTLSSGTWSTVPSASGRPTVSTITGVNTASLTFTATSTSSVNDVLRLNGAKVNFAVLVGPITATVNDGSNTATATIATSTQQLRLGGSDRYGTGAALFDSVFSTEKNVVLTSGTNYPDALSATLLARQLDTGVLTTDPGSLTAATKQELFSHGVETVYVVGGTSAVSANVVSQIQALHVSNTPSLANLQVVRVGGSDRYATNALVDRLNIASATTAIVATGENYADALAVGPAIYRTGDPLVLTTGASLATAAKATLVGLGVSHVVIVGGTSAVSSTVESQIKSLGINVDYRIGGSDRTETAANIAKWETAGLDAVGTTYAALTGLAFSGTSVVDLARGDGFADALIAGPVAGKGQTAVLLSSNSTVLGIGASEFLRGRLAITTGVRAVGLSSAVSPAVLAAAAASIA